jgi:hypothetical protein
MVALMAALGHHGGQERAILDHPARHVPAGLPPGQGAVLCVAQNLAG